MLFVALAGPFVFWGIWEKPKFEMNSIHLWGFRGLGGSSSAYCSVVEELEGAVVEKPAVDSGAAAI